MNAKRWIRPIMFSLLLAMALPLTVMGQAVLVKSDCLDPIMGYSPNNCKANDLQLVTIGLGSFNSAKAAQCLNSSGNASVYLRAEISNAAGSPRYDVGLWFNLLGGSAQTDTRTNACGRGMFTPITRAGQDLQPPCKDSISYDQTSFTPETNVCGVDLTCGNPPPPGAAPPDTGGVNCGSAVNNGCHDGKGNNIPCTATRRYFNADLGPNGSKDFTGDLCGDYVKFGGSYSLDCGRILNPLLGQDPSVRDQLGGCNNPDGSEDDVTVEDFDSPTDFSCSANSNGFLTIGSCDSWNVNAATQCNSPTEAIPGGPSKCHCTDAQPTDFPVPNLQLACSGTASDGSTPLGCTTSTNGGPVTCKVEYTNTLTPACSNDPAVTGFSAYPVERYRCGTGAYVYFQTTANDNGLGTISGPASANPPASTNTADNPDFQASASTLDWYPHDQGCTAANNCAYEQSTDPGLGIIGAGDHAIETFTYTPPAGSTGQALTTTAYWSNNGPTTGTPFSPSSANQTVTCSMPATTPVTLAAVKVNRDGDQVDFQWSTQTTVGDAGFNIYGETSKGLVKLNRDLIPAQSINGFGDQTYDFSTTASDLISNEFYIADVSTTGLEVKHGPFRGGQTYGKIVPVEKIDWASIKSEHEAAVRDRQNQGPAGIHSLVAQAKIKNAAPTFPSVNLEVNKTGLYRVTYEALVAAGFDFAGASARDLALTSQGNDIERFITGGSTFGPGSAIEFYGKALDTLYTDTNVYTLSVDHKHAEEASTDRSGSPARDFSPYYMKTSLVDGRNGYDTTSPADTPWYYAGMGVTSSARTYNFSVDAGQFAGDQVPSILKVELTGLTAQAANPDHHVQVVFDGTMVADAKFDGVTDKAVEVSLPAGLVHDGTNSLQLVLPADTGAAVDDVHLVRYSLTYPRLFSAENGSLTFSSSGGSFQVSGLSSPKVDVFGVSGNALTQIDRVDVSGSASPYTASFAGDHSDSTYVVMPTNGFLTPTFAATRDGSSILSGDAQYLIISHPDFINDLSPLIQAHTVDGMSVKVVNVEDVYAEFSYGIFDANAIHDYIKYAVKNLGTQYVLLVGGDTYDYRDYIHPNAISFIPTLYAATGGTVHWAPVDPLFADVNGDGVPDVALGRIPARSATELQNVIQKTLSYRARDYGETAIFSADGFDAGENVSFSAISDQFLSAVPSSWTTSKAYVDDLGVAGAKSALIGAIDNGVAFTSFVGHSSIYQLGFPSIFSTADVNGLTNFNRPTVFAQWGCWNTYYSSSTAYTLGLKLLLKDENGAAAVLGATTLTEAQSDKALGMLLMPKLMNGETIGQAMLEAKQEIGKHPSGRTDVLLGWTELGDPAIRVAPQQ